MRESGTMSRLLCRLGNLGGDCNVLIGIIGYEESLLTLGGRRFWYIVDEPMGTWWDEDYAASNQ